jgi:hypothetical protein
LYRQSALNPEIPEENSVLREFQGLGGDRVFSLIREISGRSLVDPFVALN